MNEKEDIIWCKEGCGNNVHRACFEIWKKSKHGGQVTCVWCRADWPEDTPAKDGLKRKDGYVNLAKLQVSDETWLSKFYLKSL